LVLGFSPKPQLLGQAAVVSSFPLPEWQAQINRCFTQMRHHFLHIDGPIGKKLLKQKPVFRRVRMKGKSPPLDGNVVFFFQLFNTPGNEVAPRSDVIGENLKD
jgi:hypothetical protein